MDGFETLLIEIETYIAEFEDGLQMSTCSMSDIFEIVLLLETVKNFPCTHRHLAEKTIALPLHDTPDMSEELVLNALQACHDLMTNFMTDEEREALGQHFVHFRPNTFVWARPPSFFKEGEVPDDEEIMAAVEAVEQSMSEEDASL